MARATATIPDPQAEWRAAGALDVLDRAVVVDSLDAAIADCTLVVGTSTRTRRIPWPLLTAREIGPHIRRESLQNADRGVVRT